MKPKYYLIFLTIAFLFLISYITRGSFLGYDSYYFLNIVYGKMISGESAFFTWFFSLLPENIILLKTILIIPFLASMIIVAKTGQLIFGERGWLAGVLLIFNGAFVFGSLKFEDEQFIYPILFFALYCFVYCLQKKKRIAAFLIPAGIIAIAYTMWISQGVSIPFMASPEYVPFASAPSMIFGLIGLAGYVKDKRLANLTLPAITLTIVALIIPKLDMFAAPLLALGLYAVIEKFEDLKKLDRKIIIWVAIGFALLSILYLPIQMPYTYEMDAVKTTVKVSQDWNAPIINDWTYGYLIIWQGGLSENYGGGQSITDFNQSIALTKQKLGCELIQTFEKVSIYNCLS